MRVRLAALRTAESLRVIATRLVVFAVPVCPGSRSTSTSTVAVADLDRFGGSPSSQQLRPRPPHRSSCCTPPASPSSAASGCRSGPCTPARSRPICGPPACSRRGRQRARRGGAHRAISCASAAASASGARSPSSRSSARSSCCSRTRPRSAARPTSSPATSSPSRGLRRARRHRGREHGERARRGSCAAASCAFSLVTRLADARHRLPGVRRMSATELRDPFEVQSTSMPSARSRASARTRRRGRSTPGSAAGSCCSRSR